MNSQHRADEILTQLDNDHLRLLQVCVDVPKDSLGTFCGKWIKNCCSQQGIPFSPGWLRKLVTVGLLERHDLSRSGKRRYYRITDMALIQDVLSLQPA